jgi:2'-5' RNA ligase
LSKNERGEHEKNLRLFVAVELPDDVKAALAAAIDLLRRVTGERGLRWVRAEGIHVTLKFLGAVPESRVEAIIDGLHSALGQAAIAPFELQPYRFGAFHGGRHMPVEFRGTREAYHYNLRVVWVGMQGNIEALARLAARIESAIAPLGYPTERRPFAAHLTLARMRDDADRATRESVSEALEQYLSESTRTSNFRPELVPEFPTFRVDHVSLMHSTAQPGGAVYRAVETFHLDTAESCP